LNGLFGVVCVVVTLPTKRSQFGFVAFQDKAGLSHFLSEFAMQGRVAEFGYGAALRANDQDVVRVAGSVLAGGPGVYRIEPVDEAFGNKEVERPIYRRGRCAGLYFANFVEQLVGFDAAATLQKNFKHFAAYGRQAFAALGAELFGRIELGVDRRGGVLVFTWHVRILGVCYNITLSSRFSNIHYVCFCAFCAQAQVL